MHSNDRPVRVMLWLFCIIVLSKILWYDLRDVLLPSDRREFLTAAQIFWVVLQAFLMLFCYRSLLRNITTPAFIWAAISAPYFFVGIFSNGFNAFFLNDLARYGLPFFWICFFSWIGKRLSLAEITKVFCVVLSGYMIIRLGVFFILTADDMEYGRHWELLVTVFLVSSALVAGRRIGFLTVYLVISSSIICLGGGRALVAGIATSGIAAVVLATFTLGPRVIGTGARAIPALVSIAIVLAFFALAPASRDIGFGNDIYSEASEQVDGGAWSVSGLTNKWIESVNNGKGTLDTRYWEMKRFLAITISNPSHFWLGVGAGHSETINVRGDERIVRGSHNTYVTLLFRHGFIIGTAIIIFVCAFGLRQNWYDFNHNPDINHRAVLLALLSYRSSIIILSLLHQGLFDDPFIWFAIVLSNINRSTTLTHNKTRLSLTRSRY